MHFSCHLVWFPDCSNNTKLPDRWNHVKTPTWSWIHGLRYFLQPTVDEVLQFLPGRRTARITLTGRRLSPASKRRRICCVESEMKTNTLTCHHSHDSLVSLLVVWLLIYEILKYTDLFQFHTGLHWCWFALLQLLFACNEISSTSKMTFIMYVMLKVIYSKLVV